MEKEREVKRRAVERARQELETRKRIEARLMAKQKVEAKLKMEEKGNCSLTVGRGAVGLSGNVFTC